MTQQELDEVSVANEKVANRRKFLKSAGFTGLGLASAGILAGKAGAFDNSPVAKALGIKTPTVQAAEDIDLDILNFALNLEYLEAEFYTVATTGKTISQAGLGTSGVGTEGPTTGGNKVDLTIPDQSALTAQLVAVADELTYDEQTHVTLIRGALGSMAVAKPAINLAAFNVGFLNYAHFLFLARMLEDTGVSAYNGAAPLITSKAYLAVAAEIALTESNHSGNIRLMTAINGVQGMYPLDGLDVLPPPAGKNYFCIDKNALSISRSTGQVLAIVYHNGTLGTTKGGAFPAGFNGAINTVTPTPSS